MKDIMTKRWMLPGRGMLALLLTLCCLVPRLAWADYDCTYSSDGGELTFEHECPQCGTTFHKGYNIHWDEYSFDEAYDDFQDECSDKFCEDCGVCLINTNWLCCSLHHCQICEACMDEPACYACYDESPAGSYCESCKSSMDNNLKFHCNFCDYHFGWETGEKCECGQSWQHCTDCVDLSCKDCGVCLIIDGEYTDASDGGCEEHELCNQCIQNDDEHCRDCTTCEEEMCDECGQCFSCIESNNTHCPECEHCFGFGNEVQQCLVGGDHCTNCCEENGWICDECGDCAEGEGQEICGDCGLCEGCCLANSEDAGCTHGYCLESSDYADHVCPACYECPDDTECEYCGLCEDCQSDYHCEHGLCPEGDEWEEHLCTDCGDCFDPDELCEFCGKCESCAEGYHCEHDYCPDDGSFEDDGDHFICDQCGDCFEGGDRCDECELCITCCQANTESVGCTHELCVESSEFMEHWCYADEQCLEKCNHDADCVHANVGTEWESDGNAHWHVCLDCGGAVDKDAHTEGESVTIAEPNSEQHRNGKANVFCAICEQFFCTVSIPYLPIPEDGSPYIIDQPKDYEGKVSDVAFGETPRYATYTVRAGGKNLSYQWYRTIRSSTPVKLVDEQGGWFDVSGKADVSGATTKSLTVFIYGSSCYDTYEYYCVVSNDKGSVTTKRAKQNAQHVFNRYEWIDAEKHIFACAGDGCEEVKKTSKHRFDEWTLIRPATDTQTGLYEQKCMDCGYKKQTVIPKVEPGHVHTFDVARSSTTTHWFVCKCGVASPNAPQAHSFGTPVVLTPATETRTGQQQLTCTICDFTKIETIDKLPHTHDFYSWYDDEMFVLDPNTHRYVLDPNKAGCDKYEHVVFCKSGDRVMQKEAHTWNMYVSKEATATQIGRVIYTCEVCKYKIEKTFKLGTYPVLVLNGTAEPAVAAPGETVTLTYDRNISKSTGLSYPVKFKKWNNLHEGALPYGSGWAEPLEANFANANASTTTFVMPNGFVAIIADYQRCYHSGGTVMSERVEPTCKGYGHEPDKLCADCGEVLEPGEQIRALGHDLPRTPIPGTEEVYYCTNRVKNQLTGYVQADIPNPDHTHGYSGDFLCNRCGERVKGKNTPLTHGLDIFVSPYGVLEGPDYWIQEVGAHESTCTTDGYTGDTYCMFCNKLMWRGDREDRLGHDWGNWETIREATTRVKGMEQRFCLNDASHKETRVTDYSGPDYRLKADKTMLNFEFTYGDTSIEPQTVTFTSVGRNEVLEIEDAEANTLGSIGSDGLKLTVSLISNERDIDEIMAIPAKERKVNLISVVTADGTTTDFTAPTISYTVTMNKANPLLRLAKSSVIARIGRPFMSPEVTSPRMEDFTISWRSLNNSVATINAQTGEVTPLSAGTATIMGYFAGDEHYRYARVFYTITVIGEQQFAGSLWQVFVAGSNQAVIGPTDHTLTMKPSTSGAGKVDVSYGAFVLASSRDKLSGFTVSGVDVSDMEDGRVFYDLPDSKRITIPTRSGFMMADVTMEGGQVTWDGTPIMILNLTAANKENVIVFGPESLTLEQILNVYTTSVDEIPSETKSDAIYDLSGRKIDKIRQPGIYIKGGKKVVVK